MRAAGDALDRLLDERLPFRDATSDRFLPPLLASGPGVCAVVFYGSCLGGAGAADSEPDFFLVVDSLAQQARHDKRYSRPEQQENLDNRGNIDKRNADHRTEFP